MTRRRRVLAPSYALERARLSCLYNKMIVSNYVERMIVHTHPHFRHISSPSPQKLQHGGREGSGSMDFATTISSAVSSTGIEM